MKGILTKYKIPLALSALILLALWPLSSFIFTSKWDNLDCFLPYRYFVSYAFSQGEWPLWNPFQQLGYPAYSDTQNGMYSPIVWILVLFGQYDSISLSIELLFYYVIGITGAYKIAELFVNTISARILIALAYGFSGYMMGNSQIMIFVAGAAFLPHILYHLIKFCQENSSIQMYWFVLFTALHFTSATPAYTIILVYILALVLAYFSIKKFQKKEPAIFNSKFFISLFILFLLILPFINSVWEFLPYMKRGKKLEFGPYYLQNPFDWHEYLSFIFPYATLAQSEWFGNTDLTARCAYIGIFPFLLALLSFKFFKDSKVKILWLVVVGSLILAGGAHTPVYQYTYHLPGFGLFRHPSIFRIYAILSLAILAGISFENIAQFSKKWLFVGMIIITSLFVFTLLFTFLNRYHDDLSSFLSSWSKLIPPTHHFMRTYLLLNSTVCAMLCLIVLFVYKHKHFKNITLMMILIDLVIYTQFTSSHTIHLHTQQDHFKNYFSHLPVSIDQKCISKPYKHLVENYEPKQEGLWRNVATFHKSLSYDANNQTQFIAFNIIEENKGLELTKENPLFYDINKKIVLDSNSILEPNILWQWDVDEYTPVINSNHLELTDTIVELNKFSVFAKNNSEKEDVLILNQNYHSNWKATINGKEAKIVLANQALMGITIPAHFKGVVNYEFNSPNTKIFFILSVAGYLFLMGLIFYSSKKSK